MKDAFLYINLIIWLSTILLAKILYLSMEQLSLLIMLIIYIFPKEALIIYQVQ